MDECKVLVINYKDNKLNISIKVIFENILEELSRISFLMYIMNISND